MINAQRVVAEVARTRCSYLKRPMSRVAPSPNEQGQHLCENIFTSLKGPSTVLFRRRSGSSEMCRSHLIFMISRNQLSMVSSRAVRPTAQDFVAI